MEDSENKTKENTPVIVTVECPLGKQYPISIIIENDTIPSIKNMISSLPELMYYTSYQLHLINHKEVIELKDTTVLSTLPISKDSVLRMGVEYTEYDVKVHIQNFTSSFKSSLLGKTLDAKSLQLPDSIKSYGAAMDQLSDMIQKKMDTEKKVDSDSGLVEVSDNATEAVNPPETAPPAVDVQKQTDILPPVVTPEIPQSAVDGQTQTTILPPVNIPNTSELSEMRQFIDSTKEKLPRLLEKYPIESVPIRWTLRTLNDLTTEKMAANPTENTSCFKTVKISGWNPVPSNRKMLGDLLYIEIETLSNEIFFVTAVPSGFYVNKSRRDWFDPSPAQKSYFSKTIHDLLKQISPEYRSHSNFLMNSNLSPLQSNANIYDTITTTPIPLVLSSKSWFINENDIKEENSFTREDNNKELETVTDWNLEYQTYTSMTPTSEMEILYYSSALYELKVKFSQYCTSLLPSIIEGSVAKISCSAFGNKEIYLINEVVFITLDTNNKNEMDDANRELQAFKFFNIEIGTKFHSLLTSIVEYYGKRFLVKAIYPGLIDNTSKLVYGYDNNNNFLNPKEITEELTELFKLFGVGTCELNSKGDIITVPGSPKIKIYLGEDGRYYLHNLGSLHSVHFEIPEEESANLKMTSDYLRLELIKKYLLKLAEDHQEKNKDLKEGETMPEFDLKLINVGLDDANVTKEAEAMDFYRKLETFAKTNFELYLKEILLNSREINDSKELSISLHTEGYKVRSLGSIASQLGTKLEDLETRQYNLLLICETAIISRSVKHILRKISTNPLFNILPSYVIVTILNIIIGSVNPLPGSSELVYTPPTFDETIKGPLKERVCILPQKLNSKLKLMDELIHYESIWDMLENDVSEYYYYKLKMFSNPTKSKRIWSLTEKYSLLRSICKELNIQLIQKEINFNESNPIHLEDIFQISPILKSCTKSLPDSSLSGLFQKMQLNYSYGQFQSAFEDGQNLILYIMQIYSFPHRLTGSTLKLLGMILNNLEDFEGAILFQKRVLHLYRKLYGEDDPEYARELKQLALYYFKTQKYSEGVDCMKKSICIMDFSSGDSNLFSVYAFIQLGGLMRTMSHIPYALECYAEALRRVDGDFLLQPQILRELSVTEALFGNYDNAIKYEEINQKILTPILGEEHEETKRLIKIIEVYKRLKEEMK